MKRNPGSDFYSVQEAADALGVQTKTLRGFIRRGGLKASKVGRVIRIRKSDLDKWLNDRRVIK